MATPPAAPSHTWTLEPGVLAALARQTRFATSKDATRPILTGVQVRIGRDGQMLVVGTDGTRLSHASAPVSDWAGAPAPFVVARRAVLDAARLADPGGAIPRCSASCPSTIRPTSPWIAMPGSRR